MPRCRRPSACPVPQAKRSTEASPSRRKRRPPARETLAEARRSTSAPRRRWLHGGRFYFDTAAAAHAVTWIETYCRFAEGEWYGRPFRLARWQRRIVRKLFGWKRADGTRRFRRLWLEVPRKNGKTEFAAALALYLFVGIGDRTAQIYSLASDKDQASIVFKKAKAMAEMEPAFSSSIDALATGLWCSTLLSSFKPLASVPNSKHGFNPSGVIADEVHAWKSDEIYNVVHEGEAARAEPLDVLITTAGVREGFAWDMHQHAEAVLAGKVVEEELLVVIFAAAEDDDWTDPKIWAKANPNLNVSVKLDFLESECRAARASPRKQNRFRQYKLNQWTGQVDRWIPMEYWDLNTIAPSERALKLFLSDTELDENLRAAALAKRAPDPDLWKKLPEKMRGRLCNGGLDLATTRDICSLCWEFQPTVDDPLVTYIWRFFLPRDRLKDLSADDKRRYEAFDAAGALFLTPGNVTDYGFIKKQFLADAALFRIGTTGVDRWNATQLVVDLKETEGANVELFGQGFASMSGPAKDFERLFLGLGLEHGNHPVARWMADNVATDSDPADNIKPTKERSAGKIDGIVAAIMARGMSMANPVKRSIYEIEAEALAAARIAAE